MKKFLFLLLALLLLFGCSPQKRLQRLIKHNPELVDTTFIKDTVVVPGWQYDTIVQLGETDTVIITKNGTTVTLYKTLYDSIFVDVLSEPDTIFKEIPCPQIMPLEAKDDWYIEYWWLILFIFVAILFILNKIFK